MIEPGRTYWYVNKPSDVDAAHLLAYLTRGEWVSPSPESHRAKLESMEVGARIALKSLSRRIADLPFFTGENPASVMTIHATGSISAVNPELGTVRVTWDTAATDREWYFGTGIHGVWGLKGGKENWSDALLAFTFDGEPQDLAPYLSYPYWASRYAPLPSFSWIPFYEQVASRLLAFRDDPAGLAARLVELSQSVPNLGYLVTDQFSDGTSGPIREIDPFTVMGTFNRGMTDENRQRRRPGDRLDAGRLASRPDRLRRDPDSQQPEVVVHQLLEEPVPRRCAGAVADPGRRGGARRCSVAGAARRVR